MWSEGWSTSPVPGIVQGQVGWSFGQPGLVEGITACGRGLEVDGLCGPFQPKPFWFHDFFPVTSCCLRCLFSTLLLNSWRGVHASPLILLDYPLICIRTLTNFSWPEVKWFASGKKKLKLLDQLLYCYFWSVLNFLLQLTAQSSNQL